MRFLSILNQFVMFFFFGGGKTQLYIMIGITSKSVQFVHNFAKSATNRHLTYKSFYIQPPLYFTFLPSSLYILIMHTEASTTHQVQRFHVLLRASHQVLSGQYAQRFPSIAAPFLYRVRTLPSRERYSLRSRQR